MKKIPGDIILLYIHMYHKWRSYDIWFLKYKVSKTGHFGSFFSSLTTWKINYTVEKNSWRYYHFTYLHHKWQSFDVWFLRYGARQTIFCHSRMFFSLLPPYEPIESKFLKKWKKKILSFYKFVPLMAFIWCMVPQIWSVTDRLFLSFWTTLYTFTILTTLLKKF